MDRRAFLSGITLSLLGEPLAARAQTAGKVSRVGALGFGVPASPEEIAKQPFWVAMKELGWIEGQTMVVEQRYGKSGDQLDAAAAELVRLKVDIIVAFTGTQAGAARKATQTIPIVMTASGDAVRQGLVASLAQPGGNVTGLTAIAPELSRKRLELLRETVPIAPVPFTQELRPLRLLADDPSRRDGCADRPVRWCWPIVSGNVNVKVEPAPT
jgi:ABC-type uncharacterized transport system, periplasmic component